MSEIPVSENKNSLEACSLRLQQLRGAVGARAGRKLTQTEFAERAGLTQGGYTHYENALRLPSIDAAAKLVDAYGITLDWLYLGNEAAMPFDLIREINRQSKPDAL